MLHQTSGLMANREEGVLTCLGIFMLLYAIVVRFSDAVSNIY